MYVSHVPHPAPFGDVTARWLTLSEADRDWHARRLVGVPVADAGICHPRPDGPDRYPQRVAHARSGGAVALGWLAVVDGPLLVARGRPLLERDPSEWGSVCLALLHDTVARSIWPMGCGCAAVSSSGWGSGCGGSSAGGCPATRPRARTIVHSRRTVVRRLGEPVIVAAGSTPTSSCGG